MSQPQLVRTARCFFETFRQRWVTVTTTGNPFHRDYVPHGRRSSYYDDYTKAVYYQEGRAGRMVQYVGKHLKPCKYINGRVVEQKD